MEKHPDYFVLDKVKGDFSSPEDELLQWLCNGDKSLAERTYNIVHVPNFDSKFTYDFTTFDDLPKIPCVKQVKLDFVLREYKIDRGQVAPIKRELSITSDLGFPIQKRYLGVKKKR